MNSAQFNRETHQADVCVIGGGMAGLCAAIASARYGAETVLIHDRPVFGGSASSEVRMWICGAHGKNNKETGILEEIQLENAARNPTLNYSVWDSVLWGKAMFQPHLTLVLNAAVIDAKCDQSSAAETKIESVTAYQSTSQTMHTIAARQFVDCSGDSIMAVLTPAEFRKGREARAEFDEDIQPLEADDKTMGNTILLQLRRTEEPHPYTPPAWAYKFTKPEDFRHRMRGVDGANFWWIEIGGLDDTIRDAEKIAIELKRVTYGVWDYIKNYAPNREKSANWAIEWIGSLPGKRENRRYIGDHTLCQNEVRAGGQFDDIIAYGGWSMDDHHPAGLYYPGEPTIFHPAPSPYGIPYRSLYSKNIGNLLFAGRNISVTHAALSSTRVMATCSIIGQASGTAAAMCVRNRCAPRALSSGARLRDLQRTLMDDDCWLPGLQRAPSAVAQIAQLRGAGKGAELVRGGNERDINDVDCAWEAPLGSSLNYEWNQPVNIAGARLVLDSKLANRKRMPSSYPQKAGVNRLPDTLLRNFRIETRDSKGQWSVAERVEDNAQRLVKVPLEMAVTGLRLVPEASWGAEGARVFSFEPLQDLGSPIPPCPEGPSWDQVVARLDPRDLAKPASKLAGTPRADAA